MAQLPLYQELPFMQEAFSFQSAVSDFHRSQPILDDVGMKIEIDQFLEKQQPLLYPELVDPLHAIYNSTHKQWALGWHPNGSDVYLFMLDSHPDKSVPSIHIYRNGHAIYQQEEQFFNVTHKAFKRLLFEHDNNVTDEKFFHPIIEMTHSQEQQNHRILHLFQTIALHPVCWPFIKPLLIKTLVQKTSSEAVVLDLEKIYAVAAKNNILSLASRLLDYGFFTKNERNQLTDYFKQTNHDYIQLLVHLNPLSKQVLRPYYMEFNRLQHLYQQRIEPFSKRHQNPFLKPQSSLRYTTGKSSVSVGTRPKPYERIPALY